MRLFLPAMTGIIALFSMVFNSGSPSAFAQSGTTTKVANDFVKSPVFEKALDYEKFTKIEGCTEERVREVKYHACRDSKALYEAAIENAKTSGKPLMVIFGFNKCPYCQVLDGQVFNPEKPLRGGNVAQYLSKPELKTYLEKKEPLKVPVLRLHARSEHGLKLADELGVTEMAQERGWHRVWSPFVVFVNPQTGKMASHSKWEAKEIYCDWSVNIATGLETIGMAKTGTPYKERKRCPKA